MLMLCNFRSKTSNDMSDKEKDLAREVMEGALKNLKLNEEDMETFFNLEEVVNEVWYKGVGTKTVKIEIVTLVMLYGYLYLFLHY